MWKKKISRVFFKRLTKFHEPLTRVRFLQKSNKLFTAFVHFQNILDSLRQFISRTKKGLIKRRHILNIYVKLKCKYRTTEKRLALIKPAKFFYSKNPKILTILLAPIFVSNKTVSKFKKKNVFAIFDDDFHTKGLCNFSINLLIQIGTF